MPEDPMASILALTKQSLAILSTSTTRDDELKALIKAAAHDMARQGITVDETFTENDDLINATMVMFVKANFGMIDEKQKEYAKETYILLCHNLGLSKGYKESEE